MGLKFSSDEKYLYASGGNDNWILKYSLNNNRLKIQDTIKLGNPWPERISPTGIDIDDAAGKLYVVTKDNNALYVIDIQSKLILEKLTLPGEAYTCALSKNKQELYISCWGAGKLVIYHTSDKKITDEIIVGSNPNDFCISKSGKYLFLANANDNSVSVINLITKKQIETLNAALYPNAPSGSTTNAVALSADEKHCISPMPIIIV